MITSDKVPPFPSREDVERVVHKVVAKVQAKGTVAVIRAADKETPRES